MKNLMGHFVVVLCLVSSSVLAKTVYLYNQAKSDIEITYQVCNVSTLSNYHCAGSNVIPITLAASKTTPVNVDTSSNKYKGIVVIEAKTPDKKYKIQYPGQACSLPAYHNEDNKLFFNLKDIKGAKTGTVSCAHSAE